MNTLISATLVAPWPIVAGSVLGSNGLVKNWRIKNSMRGQ